jgi:hypothetical protein
MKPIEARAERSEVILRCDTNSEGQIEEARKGIGISDNELDETKEESMRSLYTKSFGQKIDLNLFDWRAKR